MLTHRVLVDDSGAEEKVVCGTVKLDSIADVYAMDPTLPPTCPKCLAFYVKHQTAQEMTMKNRTRVQVPRLDAFTRQYIETALW